MTTIDDVARVAGVSTATVSRALRELPGVSAETRQRVREVAYHLEYVASPSASRLAGGRTGSVAVIVPWITRWFFATVVEAAAETLYDAGWDVLLYQLGLDNSSGRERTRRQLFGTGALHKRVDALMLVGTPLDDEDQHAIAGAPLPGVTVGAGTRVPGWSSIRIDDVSAARTAADHLIGLGHTRIAHLNSVPHAPRRFRTEADRRIGYADALRAAGLSPDPALEAYAESTVAGGEAATRELLSRTAAFGRAGRRPHWRDGPTAIFAACDEMAFGTMRALREAGIRVPEDMSVIGIDDHDLAAAVGLTTVAQPAALQGRRAAEAILAPLRHGEAGLPADEVMPTRLVVRDSTAAPCEDS
jgi:LacI family transcriptional regulator, repressor for deo operon, udp, cdd, tsx, nupC, and nupG